MIAEFVALDWVFCAIVLISALMSLFKGLIREALSLGTWIVAFFGSRALGSKAEFLFEGYLDGIYLSVAGFATVFIAILLLGAAVRFALGALVEATGLTWTDRLLGTFFGAARGALIVTVAVGIINLSPLRSAGWFSQSSLVPEFIMVAEWAVSELWQGSPVSTALEEN